jgi:hypothetical protein
MRNADGRKEAGRQQQNRQRASELSEPIWDRIRDAEDAADGAIKVDRRIGTALTTFQLAWFLGKAL